jgi:hypothetical protein
VTGQSESTEAAVSPSVILLAIVAAQPVARAEGLATRLGGPTYVGREKAGQELVALGRASIGTLRRGVSSSDPEIGERCRRLLPFAEQEAIRQRVAVLLKTPPRPVPDDAPFAKKLLAITGDTREARELYVDIYVANSAVLDSIDRAGPRAAKVFWDWVDRLLNPKDEISEMVQWDRSPAPRPVISRGDVALFWLLSTDSAFKAEKYSVVAKHAIQFDTSAAALEALSSSNGACLRRLLLARLTGPYDVNNIGIEATRVQTAFKLAADAKLKEARPIALKLALDKEEWHVARAAALMALIKIGEAKDVKALAPLASDDTTLGAGHAGQVLLGDVALATCVVLSGRSLKDFGFKHAYEGIAAGCSDAFHFGFFEAAQRVTARETWKRYYDSQSSAAGGKR